ncbi:MAG: hypothetical protein E7460_01915 [Ruminococcaceae bacterium]|nr:hypothetical protein [Oscillospiraceae bacterium]
MLNWIITSSLLILAVTALRAVFRKRIDPRLIYCVWAIVLIRLLLPFNLFQSRLSVLNLVPEKQTEYVLGEAELSPEALPAPAPAPETQNKPGAKAVFAVLWATGSVITAGIFAYSNLRFSRGLKRDRRPVLVEGCIIPVYETAGVSSPCLFGFIRPKIYVPSPRAEDPGFFTHTLVHEQTHFLHGDHIWSALRCLCICVHWFNPLVWLGAALSAEDAEMACDEGTVRRLGEDARWNYGKTLIGMSTDKSLSPLVSATALNRPGLNLKRRIVSLAKKPRTKLLAALLAVLMLLFSAGATLTGAELSRASLREHLASVASGMHENGRLEEVIRLSYDPGKTDMFTGKTVEIDIYSYSIGEISADGKSAICWVSFHVLPQDPETYSPGYLETAGTGKYLGWIRATTGVVMQQNKNGSWVCVYASPGAALPE